MKKAFLISILSLCSILSWAQSSHESAWFETIATGTNVITRARNTMQNITYLDEYVGGQYTGVFILSSTDVSSFRQCNFISNYYVKDFYVYNDTIFFCGSNLSSTQAIIGKIGVNDLFTSAAPSYRYFLPTDVRTLSKIAAYRLGDGRTHCLSIGTMNNSSVSTQPVQCYLETLSNAMSATSSNISYNEYSGNPSSLPYEWYSDIVVTDNYVCIIGQQVATPPAKMMIKLCSLSQPSTSFDSYCFTNTPATEMVHLPYATRMDRDTIAIASLCVQNNSTTNFETRFRFVDVNSMKMYHSQSYPLQDRSDIYAMTYVPDIRSVVVSQQISAECFFFPLLHNQIYAYDSWGIRHTSGCFYGLCANEGRYFIATNGTLWLSKDASVDPNTVSSNCYISDKHHVNIISNLSEQMYFLQDQPLSPSVPLMTFTGHTASSLSRPNNCIHY